MYLSSLATAVPARRYTRDECWNAFTASDWFARLDERSRTLARLVLTRDNGMESRWLAVDSLAQAFAIDPDTLQRRFATHAPQLAASAPRVPLERASVRAAELDTILVTTCGYNTCPHTICDFNRRLAS